MESSVAGNMGKTRGSDIIISMGMEKGDTLFAVETPAGYLLTPFDPEVEQQVALGLEFMAKYRDTFRALAK
jgi:hypothetical protein